MEQIELKKRVASKLNIVNDLKESSVIERVVENAKKIDGMITARYYIRRTQNSTKEQPSGYMSKEINKIFKNEQEFIDYTIKFFNLSDKEIIKLTEL